MCESSYTAKMCMSIYMTLCVLNAVTLYTYYRYGFQRLHVDNRITCLIGLLLALSGSLIATDWQSLGGDSCNQFSNIANLSEDVFHNTSLDSSGSGQVESSLCDINSEGYLCTAERYGISLEHCVEDGVASANASCVCEAFSDDLDCFWNPHSRVTGRECPRCAQLCRSRRRSLYLPQFLLGTSLMCLSVPIGRISLTLITSDAMAGESQVRYTVYTVIQCQHTM